LVKEQARLIDLPLIPVSNPKLVDIQRRSLPPRHAPTLNPTIFDDFQTAAPTNPNRLPEYAPTVTGEHITPKTPSLSTKDSLRK
jgi:hypothetical protein